MLAMKTFHLIREADESGVSGTGIVAEGIEFSNGKCALCWLTRFRAENISVVVMNILSLFDGISCGQVALNRLDIQFDSYFSSETDKFCIQVVKNRFPNSIQLGDINFYKCWELPNIDLVLGGSPCQGFSSAGRGLNWNDPRSKLFFRFVECLERFSPDYFLFENVHSMSEEIMKSISYELGVYPIVLDSSDFSAQSRKRYYWTNIPLAPIKDKCKTLAKDILESSNNSHKFYSIKQDISSLYRGNDQEVISYSRKRGFMYILDKAFPLMASDYKSGSKLNRNQRQNAVVNFSLNKYRRLSPLEC